MLRLRRIGLAALCMAPVMTGCVSQGEYDDIDTTARGLEAQLQDCQNTRSDLLASLDMKDRALSERDLQLRDMQAQLDEKDAQLARMGDLDSQLSDLHGRVANLGTGVDPATDRALRRLASRYPQLIGYDSGTGTVRFMSDLTFDSGSATVKQGAMDGLRQLAQTLSTPDGGMYELRVIGHTDSQTISNPATKAKYQNNRILSLYRAYAVSEALQSFGLPASRIETAGWGQYRPMVPNAADGNTPANRRVEIRLLAGASGHGGAPSAGDPGPGDVAPATPASRRESFPIK